MRLGLALLAACLLVPASLRAQAEPTPPPPTGPAEIIGGAMRDRASREMKQAAEAAGATQQPMATPEHDAGQAPPRIAVERPDPTVPIGSIAVHVVDPTGQPARNADVTLGVMHADSTRSTVAGRTDGSGLATFSKLAFGDKQAYRVNVPYQGAKYSSTPFRLPHDTGYRVDIHQLPVTRDTRFVVLYVGATSVELKDERVKVVQQVRLLNLGGATYLFPEEGTLVRFPEDYLAVQTEDVMTDQRVTESKGEGVRVRGSLPPGEVTLMWGFDLPLSGTELAFAIDVPWLTFAYRVITDAPAGMTVAVEGMPEPMLHDDEGRRMLVTEIQLKVGDARFERVHISLKGIPGPGPARFVAAALALVALIVGVWLSRRPPPGATVDPQRLQTAEIETRKAELLERARELQAQHTSGEIGPQYHQEQLELVRDELAALLLAASQQQGAAMDKQQA